MKLNAFNNIIISSLATFLFLGCELKNPVNVEHGNYEIVIQPDPEEGEDTFVKFEACFPYVIYNKDNFGDSSRIYISYIGGYPFSNIIKSECLFKIPRFSSLKNAFDIDSVSVSLYGKVWPVPFCNNLPAFKANGIIDDFEEGSTYWDDSLRTNMFDYNVQTVDTNYCWTTWNLGDYSKLKNLEGIVIKPLEYGPYWLSDYETYSSDEMDSTHLRPKWTFYCSSK